MSDPGRPGRRVRVTRSTGYGRSPGRQMPREPADATGTDPHAGAERDTVVELYDVGLRLAMLRLALVTLAVVLVPLVGLPLVLLLVPSLAAVTVAGLGLPYLLLGLLVYPLLWLASRWYLAGADRIEREYAEAVATRHGAR